jgi:hypothetical protein
METFNENVRSSNGYIECEFSGEYLAISQAADSICTKKGHEGRLK